MSDNRKTATLQFSVTDLPMLSHLFSYAAASAMMTGNPYAKRRALEYKETVDRLIPEAAKVFEGEAWCEIGICIEAAKQYGVGYESWGWDHGRIIVVVDGKSWHSSNTDLRKDGEQFAGVVALLKDIAPLQAEFIAIPDTKYGDKFKSPPSAAIEPEPVARGYGNP